MESEAEVDERIFWTVRHRDTDCIRAEQRREEDPATAAGMPIGRMLAVDKESSAYLYRQVIVERSYRRRTWKEIAELTGRPTEDAARMMYVRALKELRKGLRNTLRR